MKIILHACIKGLYLEARPKFVRMFRDATKSASYVHWNILVEKLYYIHIKSKYKIVIIYLCVVNNIELFWLLNIFILLYFESENLAYTTMHTCGLGITPFREALYSWLSLRLYIVQKFWLLSGKDIFQLVKLLVQSFEWII